MVVDQRNLTLDNHQSCKHHDGHQAVTKKHEKFAKIAAKRGPERLAENGYANFSQPFSHPELGNSFLVIVSTKYNTQTSASRYATLSGDFPFPFLKLRKIDFPVKIESWQ